jgi:hypothetical protein
VTCGLLARARCCVVPFDERESSDPSPESSPESSEERDDVVAWWREPEDAVPGSDAVDLAPVCVAEPIANEAPSAPTIPSPARPAWSLLLRWRGVMSSTLCGVPVPNL